MKIFHSVQENLALGKASTDDKCQSLGLDVVNINVYAKVYQIFQEVNELSTFFTNCPETKAAQTGR